MGKDSRGSGGNGSSGGSGSSDSTSDALEEGELLVGEGQGPWELSPALYPVLAQCDPALAFDASVYEW